jgi:predicted double-glycine peptidase
MTLINGVVPMCIHANYDKNKLGNVLNAFAHFFYEESKHSMVISDFQSKAVLLQDISFTKILPSLSSSQYTGYFCSENG